MKNEFTQYVKDKRVTIVGPAGYMKDMNQGEKIDSHDIVIRLNSALPLPEEMKKDVGQRTDILSNCLEPHPVSGGSINPQMWKSHGVEWVISPYPRSLHYISRNFKSFVKLNNGTLKFTDTSIELFESIQTKVKTRPNTGILTIMYLLSFDISSLYVTGFSFAKDGYYPGYKSSITPERYKKLANSNIHKQEPQLKYFREVCKNEPRISTDFKLKEILDEE